MLIRSRMFFLKGLGGAWRRARVVVSIAALSASVAVAADPAGSVPPGPAPCVPAVPNASNCPDNTLPGALPGAVPGAVPGAQMPAPLPSVGDAPIPGAGMTPMQPLNQGPAFNQNLLAGTPSQAFAPNMIGDFFGGTSQSQSYIFTQIDQTIFHGDGTASANDFHAFEGSPPVYQFVGGPGGGRYYFDTGVTTASGLPQVVGGGDASGLHVRRETNERVTVSDGIDTWANRIVYAIGDQQVINSVIPSGNISAAPGANVGKIKLTENTSPMPRDRVYINYSYFDNTPLFQGGVDVNRVTPGFEKTFFDGQMSFELRAPFATTLDSDVFNGPAGLTNTSNTEWGNLTMYWKALLWANDRFAVSSGLGLAVPTADDFAVRSATTGETIVKVDNNSVHLLPFIGFLGTPNERFFYQGIMQIDIDANGNPVSATDIPGGAPGASFTELGTGHDQTFMFLSMSAGYWAFLNHDPDALVNGIAPIFEYHINQSLDNGDHIQGVAGGQFYNFGSPDSVNQQNVVMGLTSIIRNNATLTAGYATPLGGADRGFDGEFRLLFNWYFGGGGLNRMSRVQF